MTTKFNRYVSKTQEIVEKTTLKTLKKHSYTLGQIAALIEQGATAEQIAEVIKTSK